MFDALRKRLAEVQDFDGRILDAAIAVATEVRNKVKKSRRAASKRRREERVDLRLRGFTAAEARARTSGGRRATSGISIDADPSGLSVRLTASDQVQYLRRERGETDDIMEVFKRHMTVGEKYRKARGL